MAELSGRTVQYGYDDLYRLTSENIVCGTGTPACAPGAVSYSYDSVGNRMQLNSTLSAVPASGLLNYDANDRTSTEVYDANGNTTFNGQQNVYDFENRLIQRGGVTIVYDGDGNRVQETVAGVTTKYLVGEVNPTGYAQVYAELSGTNSLLRGYEWGLQLEAVRDFTVNSFGTFHYYGRDGHGSVRWLTDSSGAISDIYDYDAFGNLINSIGTTFNNYLFAGEQFDPALGIYYNRARYYDQRQGRFWTADTFEGGAGDPLSLHRYLYAGVNPVNSLDPSGNFTLAEAVETAGIVGFLSGTVMGLVQGKSIGKSLVQGVVVGGLAVGLTLLGAGVAVGYGVSLGTGVLIANAPLTGLALTSALQELNSSDRATVNRGQLSIALLALAFEPGGNLSQITELDVIAALRQQTQAGRSQNIAYAFAEIDGMQSQAVSVSGIAEIPGTVSLPETPSFSTISVGGFNRAYDTERKILESYAQQITSSSAGKITIISERPACPSCQDVKAQFEHQFPRVQVEIKQASNTAATRSK